MPEQGVALIVNPGCDLESSRRAVELAHKYPFLYAAVAGTRRTAPPIPGTVWMNCAGWPPTRRWWPSERLAWTTTGRKIPPGRYSRRCSGTRWPLAEELDLPVIVHDREAPWGQPGHREGVPRGAGVFHCYSGSVEMARELVSLGWMISFTGVLTYPNARKAVEVAQAIPMEALMIETDAPYMAPVPHRGKRKPFRVGSPDLPASGRAEGIDLGRDGPNHF